MDVVDVDKDLIGRAREAVGEFFILEDLYLFLYRIKLWIKSISRLNEKYLCVSNSYFRTNSCAVEADDSCVIVGSRKSLPQAYIAADAEANSNNLRHRYSSGSSSTGTPVIIKPIGNFTKFSIMNAAPRGN